MTLAVGRKDPTALWKLVWCLLWIFQHRTEDQANANTNTLQPKQSLGKKALFTNNRTSLIAIRPPLVKGSVNDVIWCGDGDVDYCGAKHDNRGIKSTLSALGYPATNTKTVKNYRHKLSL